MKFDPQKFIHLYGAHYGALDPKQTSGLTRLLEFIGHDKEVTNLRWAAYMLATVKHECANTWQPIPEYGKGKGKRKRGQQTTHRDHRPIDSRCPSGFQRHDPVDHGKSQREGKDYQTKNA